jgi:hypothetical protein
MKKNKKKKILTLEETLKFINEHDNFVISEDGSITAEEKDRTSATENPKVDKYY